MAKYRTSDGREFASLKDAREHYRRNIKPGLNEENRSIAHIEKLEKSAAGSVWVPIR